MQMFRVFWILVLQIFQVWSRLLPLKNKKHTNTYTHISFNIYNNNQPWWQNVTPKVVNVKIVTNHWIINTVLCASYEMDTNRNNIAGFEVLTAVTKKSTIFCDVTPCSPVSPPTFQRTVLPPSLGSKSMPGRNQQEVGSKESFYQTTRHTNLGFYVRKNY